MFKRLFRNIYLPIVILAVILVLFIDIFSIIMLTDTMSIAYANNGQKRITRTLDSCQLYISSAAASTYNLSLDEEIISELSNPSGRTLIDKLDSTCNYSLKINAVCVYAKNGTIYTSSEVAQVPSLNELKEITDIKNFIDGTENATISLRTKNIAEIYNNIAYPDNMGVITCCQKVYDDDEVVGWIFTDILPSNLYDFIFTSGQFQNAVAFIKTDDFYFEYNGNSNYVRLLKDKHKGYFKYSATSDNELFSVTVFDSTSEYNTRTAVISVIMVIASVALLVGVHFIARWIAKSVTKKLDNLSDKMNSQELP